MDELINVKLDEINREILELEEIARLNLNDLNDLNGCNTHQCLNNNNNKIVELSENSNDCNDYTTKNYYMRNIDCNFQEINKEIELIKLHLSERSKQNKNIKDEESSTKLSLHSLLTINNEISFSFTTTFSELNQLKAKKNNQRLLIQQEEETINFFLKQNPLQSRKRREERNREIREVEVEIKTTSNISNNNISEA